MIFHQAGSTAYIVRYRLEGSVLTRHDLHTQRIKQSLYLNCYKTGQHNALYIKRAGYPALFID